MIIHGVFRRVRIARWPPARTSDRVAPPPRLVDAAVALRRRQDLLRRRHRVCRRHGRRRAALRGEVVRRQRLVCVDNVATGAHGVHVGPGAGRVAGGCRSGDGGGLGVNKVLLGVLDAKRRVVRLLHAGGRFVTLTM